MNWFYTNKISKVEVKYNVLFVICTAVKCAGSWSMTKWTMFEEVAEMAVKIVTYLYFKSRPFNLLRMSVRQYDEISTIYIFSTNEITALKFQMDCSSAKLVSWKKWRWSKFCCSVVRYNAGATYVVSALESNMSAQAKCNTDWNSSWKYSRIPRPFVHMTEYCGI